MVVVVFHCSCRGAVAGLRAGLDSLGRLCDCREDLESMVDCEDGCEQTSTRVQELAGSRPLCRDPFHLWMNVRHDYHRQVKGHPSHCHENLHKLVVLVEEILHGLDG